MFKNIKGSICALITPFNNDGTVNYNKLKELIEFHIKNKTDALVILGTTGESSTTTHEEDAEIIKFSVKVANGRIPIIANSGSNCTKTMKESSKIFESLGVDALLCISPYYNKTNKEGMYNHFVSVADAVNIPIILYNVPSRTGCNIPVDVVKRLSVHKNICAIKEASGDISYASKIATFLNDDFAMYSGNDDIIIPILSLGGSGVISVWANIMPSEVHNMVYDYLNGQTQCALDTQLKHLDLIDNLFVEVNPIPVKEAMNLMNMEVGGYRLPLYPMSKENKALLEASLKKLSLI